MFFPNEKFFSNSGCIFLEKCGALRLKCGRLFRPWARQRSPRFSSNSYNTPSSQSFQHYVVVPGLKFRRKKKIKKFVTNVWGRLSKVFTTYYTQCL